MAGISVSRTSIDSVSWTAIVLPIACDSFLLYTVNGTSMKLRTSSGDAGTEKMLPAGASESVLAPTKYRQSDHRFAKDATLYFAQTVSGSDTAVLTCVE